MLMDERSNILAALIAVAALFSSCTNSPAPKLKPVDAGSNQKPNTNGPGGASSGNTQLPGTESGGNGSQGTQSQSGAIKTSIQARDLQRANIDLKDLKYKFTYLDVVKEGDMVFSNDAATISIDSLPIGREGAMSLDVFQRGNKVLTGSVAAVKLQPGSQTINMALKPIAAQTSNVIINAVIDTGTSTPPPGPTPTPPPAITPVPTVVPDPLNGLNWDGKTFQGNAQWDLIPVN